MEKGSSKHVKELSVFTTSLELGFYLSIPVILGAVGGKVLDGWLGTRPWLLVAGTVTGIAIATFITVQRVTGMIAETDKEYEEEKRKKEKETQQ